MPETLPAPLKHLRGEEFTARLPVIFNTVMEGEGLGCLAKAGAFNQARTVEVCTGPEQGILDRNSSLGYAR